jgi:hypothetical protein
MIRDVLQLTRFWLLRLVKSLPFALFSLGLAVFFFLSLIYDVLGFPSFRLRMAIAIVCFLAPWIFVIVRYDRDSGLWKRDE